MLLMMLFKMYVYVIHVKLFLSYMKKKTNKQKNNSVTPSFNTVLKGDL